MYRERLTTTSVHSESAQRLQRHLLAYHDFRNAKAQHPIARWLPTLARWQAERLKATHEDLFNHPGYRDGLVFLLTDLYAPESISRRDDDIDRIFPKMVKWLPDTLLDTFAGLVELNHSTQYLDLCLLETLQDHDVNPDTLTDSQYCEAFRDSDSRPQRQRQIDLVADVGRQLNRYVKNRSLGWLLGMSRGPADMAGLEDLHSFLHRGFQAFQTMDRVDTLINEVVARETRVLDQILAVHPQPFRVAPSLARHANVV
ncbi:FFLEELY motif protein [Marinobacter caseinilyticus]|uniref:FFLEELY motif protein n=1 Tax=Marinobacter caseinilyticus TaxID=2692195 RepID=UPI00140BB4CD|nr:hypothetical protein [Marinobacter caseinilyticus]